MSVRLELRQMFRQASFIMSTEFFHVLLREKIVAHRLVELVLVDEEHGLVSRLVGGHPLRPGRDFPSLDGLDVVAGEGVHELHVLVVRLGLDFDEVLLRHPQDDFSPHHGGVLLRDENQFVAVVAVHHLVLGPLVGEVVDARGHFRHVVVGEVASHPRLSHHGRRHLHHAVDGGQPVPHLLAPFQVGLPLVFRRGGDENERELVAFHPAFDADFPLPRRADDSHRHLGVERLALVVFSGFLDDFPGGQFPFLRLGLLEMDAQEARANQNL